MRKNKISVVDIYDIDGVLLDSSHRYKTEVYKGRQRIDLNHWRENEKNCIHDAPLPLAEHYEKRLNQKGTFVIIATSRVMSALDYQVIELKLGKPRAIVSRLSNEQKGGLLKLHGCLHIFEQLKLNPKTINIYEDNAEYLKIMADGFFNLGHNVKAHYVPSKQGH